MVKVLKFQLVMLAILLGFVTSVMAQSSLDKQIEELGLEIPTPEISIAGNGANSRTSSQQSQLVGNQIRVLLKPRSNTWLSSEKSGRVRTLPYNIGDSFKKGEVLARIGCNEVISEISIAKARLNQSKIDYNSNKSLLAQGGVSKYEVEASVARVEETEAILNKYQVSAGDCTMVAPYSGKVVTRAINRYEHVSAGEQILEIIDDSKLDMQLYVPSEWVTKLTRKTAFTVYIDEVGKEYEAKVIRINPRVDAGSKTLEIIARMTKQHKELRSGMSGNATFDL